VVVAASKGVVEMKMFAVKSAAAVMLLGLGVNRALAAPAGYPTPEAATEAFVEPLEALDKDALLTVFSPEAADLISSGYKERDAESRDEFLLRCTQFHALDDLSEDTKELVIGRAIWPFPVLLVKSDAGWSFDPDIARDEILSLRIGLNELDLIEILQKATTVQAAFRSIDHHGDSVMEFASSVLFSPGQRDGL